MVKLQFFRTPLSRNSQKRIEHSSGPSSTVVQWADNTIHWINLYPMDSAMYSSILIRWIVIYPVSSATQRWSQSSRGLSDKISRWQKKEKKSFSLPLLKLRKTSLALMMT